MRRVPLLAWLTMVGLIAPHPASAQTLSELLGQLLAQGAVIATPLDQTAPNLSRSFSPAVTLATVPSQLTTGLALQLADFPLGPTAPTVIYSRDGAGPEMHQMFGGAYADRGPTIGRGKFGFALTFQNDNFPTFDGVDLNGGGVNFLFANAGPTPDTSDVLQETVSFRLNRKVTSLLVNYGVTNRLDIGAVLPIVQVAMDVRVASRIVRVRSVSDVARSCLGLGPDTRFGSTGPALRLCQDPHGYDEILTLATQSTYLNLNVSRDLAGNNYGQQGITARGIGDVVLRSKFQVVAARSASVAAAIDLSLPSGDRDNFLGTGALRATPSIVFSAVAGPVSPHASVSYTASRGNLSPLLQANAPTPINLKVPNEIGWSAGFDAAVAPRTTLVADFFGRRIDSALRFATGQTVFATGAPGVPADVAAGTDLIAIGTGALNQTYGNIGGRINLSGSVFANGSVMFPISVQGLKARPAAIFSIDYGF